MAGRDSRPCIPREDKPEPFTKSICHSHRGEKTPVLAVAERVSCGEGLATNTPRVPPRLRGCLLRRALEVVVAPMIAGTRCE